MELSDCVEKFEYYIELADKAARSEMYDTAVAWASIAQAYASLFDVRATAAERVVRQRSVSNAPSLGASTPGPSPVLPSTLRLASEENEERPNILSAYTPETNAGAPVTPPPSSGTKGGRVPCKPCGRA